MENNIQKFINSKDYFISESDYQSMYQQSLAEPDFFWAQQAEQYIDWIEPWDTVIAGEFAKGDTRWFNGAKLNVCYNCIDRHLPKQKDKTAIIWEGDEPTDSKQISYQQLYYQVCQLANGLQSLGIEKGSRVGIYLPMIPEAAIAMLACARMGAIHSVIFAGFSAAALKNRLMDAECEVLISLSSFRRGGKTIHLKDNVREAVSQCPSLQKVIMVDDVNAATAEEDTNKHYINYYELTAKQAKDFPIVAMDANDPLFILYTSGSTGKPKGILHGQAGYLLYTAMTFKLAFNYQEEDIYFCTADVGWITGHSYLVYGPLANGATTIMFAGVPSYPSFARYWQIVDKYQVNIFYTAPTAIRTLMRAGDEIIANTKRSSLKLLATVGEPINPEVWQWYYKTIGEERCPVVDTWWQTETGGMIIMPLVGACPLKPGAACKPFFGIELAIIDDNNQLVKGAGQGKLIISKPWPGALLTVFKDARRYSDTYFPKNLKAYLTGDDVKRDEDGFYWILGRTDDVLNVSGHRLDTAEIESAIVSCPWVAEAAVVGMPHEIKGQGIFAFVTLKQDCKITPELKQTIIQQVKKIISPIAVPDKIQWTEDLPKTRSGKIMRRILRKIVNDEEESLGDTSTLANPEVLKSIITNYHKQK